MGKDVPPLSLGDFKLVPLLLFINIAGFSIIFWSVFAFENTEGPNNFTIYFSLGFLLLWGVLTFVFRKGTSFLQFILLCLVSLFIVTIFSFAIEPVFSNNTLSTIIAFPSTSCCISFGIILLLRKYKKVGSNPAFIFRLSSFSLLIILSVLVFGLMNIESS